MYLQYLKTSSMMKTNIPISKLRIKVWPIPEEFPCHNIFPDPVVTTLLNSTLTIILCCSRLNSQIIMFALSTGTFTGSNHLSYIYL